MKKILLQTPYASFANNKIFETRDGNNALARWRILKDRLAAMGYDLLTADDNSLTDCEGIIFHDAISLYSPLTTSVKLKNFIKKILGMKLQEVYPTRDIYTEAVNAGLRSKLMLFIWEAKVTGPLNFSPEVWDKFDHIMVWDDSFKNHPKVTHYLMPMEVREILPVAVPFKEKKLLTNMSINKYSREKGETYSERRRAVDYFNDHYPNDFDLYGYRWGKPITIMQQIFKFLVKNYKTYRGPAEDKIGTLKKYKFNICYENIVDQAGWITEKIFNSFQAKMVSIYWGAPNITNYVDADTFIDRRKFQNNDELAKFITSMTEEEYNKYIAAGERYAKSEKYKMFLPDAFCDKVIESLNLKALK